MLKVLLVLLTVVAIFGCASLQPYTELSTLKYYTVKPDDRNTNRD